MKILWVVNFSMPAVQRKLQKTIPQSGWWLDTIAMQLKQQPDVELEVVSLVQGQGNAFCGEIDGVMYRVIPISYKDRQIKPSLGFTAQIEKLIAEIQPDVIHLQGTEFAIGIPFLQQKIFR